MTTSMTTSRVPRGNCFVFYFFWFILLSPFSLLLVYSRPLELVDYMAACRRRDDAIARELSTVQ